MSYKPKSLGHVNLFVESMERSRNWYEDVLGLHTNEVRADNVAFMAADPEQSHEIALVEVGEDAVGPQRGRVGLNHMAWRMHSLDDLKELYLRLKEKNAPIESVSDHGISIGVYIRDPDGNGVEMYYESSRSDWPRQDKIFTGEGTTRGRFPGPWDEYLAEQKAASR